MGNSKKELNPNKCLLKLLHQCHVDRYSVQTMYFYILLYWLNDLILLFISYVLKPKLIKL